MRIGTPRTRRKRLLAAGTVAALAATVLLFGGVFGQDTAARPGPFAAEAEVNRGYAELELARVRVDPSRYPLAEARFRAALRLGEADASALRGLAALAAARHRFDESLKLAQRARVFAPRNAAVYGLIGDASLELGRFPQAIEAFDRMMSLKPTPSGYARVSYARELLGDRDGAIEAMQMSAEAAGHSEPAAWALTHLGNLHVGTGGLASGMQSYRAALARVPAYAPGLVGLADVARRRGQGARAERLLRRALAQVDDPGASATLGDVLAEQGRTDEANDWYRRAHALEAEFGRHGGRNQIETALFDLDHDRNLADALERARAGLRFRPGVEGLHTYAWALYKNGRCAEAVPYSDRALALAPTDTGALFHRSLIEGCLGNSKAAARYASRVRSLDPTFLAPSAFRLR
jgi:tetratricopeptide (TPR) repeat protein